MTLYGIRGGQMRNDMGYHGRTWDLRKNNKKVKKNRTRL